MTTAGLALAARMKTYRLEFRKFRWLNRHSIEIRPSKNFDGGLL